MSKLKNLEKKIENTLIPYSKITRIREYTTWFASVQTERYTATTKDNIVMFDIKDVLEKRAKLIESYREIYDV